MTADQPEALTAEERAAEYEAAFDATFQGDFGGVDWRDDAAIQAFAARFSRARLARPAPASAATTTETVEWGGVRCLKSPAECPNCPSRNGRMETSERMAREVASSGGLAILRRTRVSTSDVVSEWTEVES